MSCFIWSRAQLNGERHQDRLEHVTHTSKQVCTHREEHWRTSRSELSLSLVLVLDSHQRHEPRQEFRFIDCCTILVMLMKITLLSLFFKISVPWLIHGVVWARKLSSNASKHNISCMNKDEEYSIYRRYPWIFHSGGEDALLRNLWQFSLREGFRTDERLPASDPFSLFSTPFHPSTEYRSTTL